MKALADNQNIEIQLIIEAIHMKYGYDFRSYAKSSLKRRVLHMLSLSGLKNISEMQHRILNDTHFFNMLLLNLSVNVSEMFRDPAFFEALRKNVIPILKTYPFLKIWHAGCSTGEEVYSMAILLEEEGLFERTRIYATDFNEKVLQKAREGIFPVERIKKYTSNYHHAGGKESFADYYTARYESAVIKESLKKNIVFADHNLATDVVFGEMHLIMCRNVLIYFNRDLQDHVFRLFRDSLAPHGFLGLGSKEELRFSKYMDDFEVFDANEKIYNKRR